MPTQRVALTITGLSSTFGYPIVAGDWNKLGPFNLGITGVMTSTAVTPAYNLEVTQDFSGSSAFLSTAATWFSSLATAVASNILLQITTPVTAIRPNVTGGSSQQTLVLTVVSG
jgi:hypothetical protein